MEKVVRVYHVMDEEGRNHEVREFRRKITNPPIGRLPEGVEDFVVRFALEDGRTVYPVDKVRTTFRTDLDVSFTVSWTEESDERE